MISLICLLVCFSNNLVLDQISDTDLRLRTRISKYAAIVQRITTALFNTVNIKLIYQAYRILISSKNRKIFPNMSKRLINKIKKVNFVHFALPQNRKKYALIKRAGTYFYACTHFFSGFSPKVKLFEPLRRREHQYRLHFN